LKTYGLLFVSDLGADRALREPSAPRPPSSCLPTSSPAITC